MESSIQTNAPDPLDQILAATSDLVEIAAALLLLVVLVLAPASESKSVLETLVVILWSIPLPLIAVALRMVRTTRAELRASHQKDRERLGTTEEPTSTAASDRSEETMVSMRLR